MPDPADHLDVTGAVVDQLGALGLEPVLVGGMALVVLGSRRVTRDFDFVIPRPEDRLPAVVDVLYDHGLELASRLDEDGDVTSTIANRKVAAARLRIDAPSSAYFFNTKTGLRIDLLFDFPLPATTLASRGTRMTIRRRKFTIASAGDLLQLKRIAQRARTSPGDAEDIAFLESHQHTPR